MKKMNIYYIKAAIKERFNLDLPIEEVKLYLLEEGLITRQQYDKIISNSQIYEKLYKPVTKSVKKESLNYDIV